jgi:hypothetical protein
MDPIVVYGLPLIATKLAVAILKGEQKAQQGGLSLGAGADVLLDMIADISKDAIWARAEKRLLQRLCSPSEALHNHHLTTAVGTSIKLVILKATEDSDLADFKPELAKVAEAASGLWTALAEAKKPELAQLSDDKLIALAAVPASSRAGLTALDVPTWENFLRTSGGSKDSPIHLPGAVFAKVADRLYRTFPQALVEVLKDDAEHGGAAFAGLQLLIFGELIAVCLDVRKSQEAQRELIESVIVDSNTRHAELVEKLDRLAKQVATQSAAVFSRLSVASRREFRDEGIRQDETVRHLWQLKTEAHLPFRPVEDRENFGDEMIPDSFRPSRSEYREGLVYRPILADDVEQSLEQTGFALVRGKGASGKTVLALTIALGERFRGHTAYYLDLTDRGKDDAEAVQKLRTLAADQVLFIVDNVHLNERVALDLLEAWRANSQGSCLLMLGRHVEKGPDLEGRQPLLGGIGPAEVFLLEVAAVDLVGTFSRLIRRTGTHVVVPIPPPPAQAAWMKLFQGSLVFFSAAVKSKLADLMHGNWALSPDDACAYVRRKYLDAKDVSKEERDSLLRVAVFARLEISASEDVLGWPHLEHSIKHGLVYRLVCGGRYTRYRLSHPGLGDLLLSAAGHPLNECEIWEQAAQRSPLDGVSIADTLLRLGKTEAGMDVLRTTLQQPKALEDITKSGLEIFHSLCRRAAESNLLTEVEQLAPVGRWGPVLTDAVKRSSLHGLTHFLRYARETPQLKGLFAAAARQLDARELAVQAAQSSFEGLTAFLVFARGTPELTGLFEAVVKQLDIGKLAAHAEQSSFGGITTFLVHARGTPELRSLFLAVIKQLDSGNIAAQAKRSPIEQLTYFLIQAEKISELKILFEEVLAKLAQPEMITALARNACTAPLPHLVSFLRNTSLAPAVVQAIDRASWDAARRKELGAQADFVHSLFQVLNKFNRPDLAEAPALALLESPNPLLWHDHAVGLHQVTQTLRLGRAVGFEARQKFLEVVVTPEWLRSAYRTANLGGIAAALFAIRSLWEPEVLEYFLRELPSDLLSRSLSRLYGADAQEANQILSLLGVSDLLGLPVNTTGVRWPPSVQLKVPETLTTMSVPIVLLMLGFRTMAKCRPDRIVLPAKLGNRLLELWRQSKHNTKQSEALNQWMIAWLERCASAGWVLLPDNSNLLLETPVPGPK